MDIAKHIRAKLLAVIIACSFIITAYPLTMQPVQTESIAKQTENWEAQPLYIMDPFSGSAGYGYTPNQIKTAYNLPSSGGSGATIAIIVAYDTPNIQSYLATFSAEFGLPAPDSSNFEIHKMASSYSADPTGKWSYEACLDVEWAHAIAPEAKILLVEAVDAGGGLFEAINYAAQRTDVIAISMSWGGPETEYIINWDAYCLNHPSIAFFAASGDHGAKVVWPASSRFVVAIGGTSLSLDGTGTIISETAWGGSGGGISNYETMPAYQRSYGLSGAYRTVPDVSYNADSSTGYPVYCGGWSKVGGTSAAAPQWAAIYALDQSATNANLYQSASTAYTSSFRDITTGSNGYSATTGYDYATGLGSPKTANFDFALNVAPNEGTGNGAITLSGNDFTAGSTVNIQYLNPQTSAWVSIVSNLPIAKQDFTYTANAPDLLQSNLAGDHSALSDSIVYRATDNSNGRTVTTIAPFKEWRRGLTQVGSTSATGIFGANSDLTSSVSVLNEQTFTITGKWFKPGTASLMWDGSISLGSAAIDGSGMFTATVQAPISVVGTHTITVNDGACDFSFDLTSYDAPPIIVPVPEGNGIAVFAAVLCAAIFVVVVKRKQK